MSDFSLIISQYGGFMDIAQNDGKIFAVQNSGQYKGGRLCVFDEVLNLISSFENIGDARQIKISDGIAVVSARANGLWIFDVKEIEPKVLSHYKTIEFATGITIYSNIVFVSCRQYGVEIVDITNPQKPVHKGIIRMGEVQSTCVYNDVLYGGLWGNMKVVAFNIKNINEPQKLFEVKLHGRGDGVVVRDNFLYAVSGQHGRNIKNFSDTSDPEFGNGNGISVFNISKNCEEIFYDSFGKGYSISIDTWKPIICGDFLVCCDSVMGVHIYNTINFEKIATMKFPKINDKEDAVTSGISCNGSLYITTAYGGIYKYDKLTFANSFSFNLDRKINVKKSEFQQQGNINLKKLYSGDFSVLSICSCEKNYAIACGNDGLNIIDENFNFLYKIKQEGFCCDVKSFGKYVIGAFSESGICIYEVKENSVKFISSYKDDKAIQQLCLSKSKKYLACCLESTEVIMLDISDVNCIKKLYSRKAKFGPLYGENFASTNLSDGTMLMFWHRDGVVYSNPDNGDEEFKDIFYDKKSSFMCFGPETGFDTDSENMFYNLNGGYVILPFNKVNVDELQIHKSTEKIIGKFIIYDNKIIAIERAEGIITVTDITDIENPKHIGKTYTTASCSKPVCINNRVFVPAWHDGLLELIL